MSKKKRLLVYKPQVGDAVVVDKLKWRTCYNAEIVWLGRQWAQVTSDRGIQTMPLSRLTLKPK